MHGTCCIKIVYEVCSQISPPPQDKPTDKCVNTLFMYQNRLPNLRKLPCKVKIPLVKPSTFLTPQFKFLNFIYFCIKLIFLSTPDTTEYINPFTKTMSLVKPTNCTYLSNHLKPHYWIKMDLKYLLHVSIPLWDHPQGA